MKQLFIISISMLLVGILSAFMSDKIAIVTQEISFYEVPLVCGAAPEIGCGSRLKPLFLDMAKAVQIEETWSNRQGTVVAVVWKNPAPTKRDRQEIVNPIFDQNIVEAQLISNKKIIAELMASLNGGDIWYRGMDVDLLSKEEAGIIAESLTAFANAEGLITNEEAALIKSDFEEYFKVELTQVRTFENLKSDATQEKWRKDGYQIYVNHIGSERAEKVSELYHSYENQDEGTKMNSKSCCNKQSKKDCCKKL